MIFFLERHKCPYVRVERDANVSFDSVFLPLSAYLATSCLTERPRWPVWGRCLWGRGVGAWGFQPAGPLSRALRIRTPQAVLSLAGLGPLAPHQWPSCETVHSHEALDLGQFGSRGPQPSSPIITSSPPSWA